MNEIYYMTATEPDRQLPVYLTAELLAGAAAAGAFVAVSRTAADTDVPDTVAELAHSEA